MANRHNAYRSGDPKPQTLLIDDAKGAEIGALCFYNSDAVELASQFTDQGDQTRNQLEFAGLFAGVMMFYKSTSDSDTDSGTVNTSGIHTFLCASTNWEMFDLVGAVENGDGDALQDHYVAKVTDPAAAIGFAVSRGTSQTSVDVFIVPGFADAVARGVLDAQALLQVAGCPEIDCGAASAETIPILPTWVNPNGLVIYDCFAVVTEAHAGDTEDQGIVTLKDSAGTTTGITFTAQDASADAVNDVVQSAGGKIVRGASTGDALAVVAATKGLNAVVTQQTSGTGAAGKFKIGVIVRPLGA